MSVVTNQAGVAFGFNTPGDVTTKLILVAQALGFAELTIHDGDSPRYHGYTRNAGGMLTAHVAYEHPKATIARYREDPNAIDSNRRKPSPVMLIEALAGLNPGRALMVGDRPEDELAAKNAGVRFVLADDFFLRLREANAWLEHSMWMRRAVRLSCRRSPDSKSRR